MEEILSTSVTPKLSAMVPTNEPIIRPPATITVTSSSDTTEDGSSDGGALETLWKKVNQVRPKNQSPIPCTIFRVPEHIRQCDAQAYEPLIIPIGPYHHRLTHKSTMQEHKWRCVRYLLSRHRGLERARQLLDYCLMMLKALDDSVRSCYSEDFPELKAHEMAELMLLDGCFIIHILLKRAKLEAWRKMEREKREVVLEVDKEIKEQDWCWRWMAGKEKMEEKQGSGIGSGKGVKRTQSDRKRNSKEPELELQMGEEEEELEDPFVAGLVTRVILLWDLLKLENQIPFFVIKALFDVLKTSGDQGIDLPECALQLFQDIDPPKSKSFQTSSMRPIHHLLHLFHSSRVNSQKCTQKYVLYPAAAPKRIRRTIELAMAGVSFRKKKEAEWIPCATALAMAGVRFRKKKEAEWIPCATELAMAGAKEADSFLDITFKDGMMEIPRLQVYGYTGSLLRNLVAFEQCHFDTMTEVTIYAMFMDRIVDEAKDVRLLHLEGILVNKLSTDEAVARLFNQLCSQVYYVADGTRLEKLFMDVNEYYGSKFHRWRAGLMRDYFSNTWTIISVIAAILLLLLTIEQAVFSCLSYYAH